MLRGLRKKLQPIEIPPNSDTFPLENQWKIQTKWKWFCKFCLVFVTSRLLLVLRGFLIFFKSVKSFGELRVLSFHFWNREITLLHFCILNTTMKLNSFKSLIAYKLGTAGLRIDVDHDFARKNIFWRLIHGICLL